MRVIAELKRHEGFRSKPYRCTAGKLTIGYGINLDEGITEREATALLAIRVAEIEKELEKMLWYKRLSDGRKAVIVNMAYNLGMAGLMKFQRMISAIQAENYVLAAREMLDSTWSGQVGNRAKELASAMVAG